VHDVLSNAGWMAPCAAIGPLIWLNGIGEAHN
jgi:hypothetical protein